MADMELARLIEVAAAAARLHFDLTLSGIHRSLTTQIAATVFPCCFTPPTREGEC
jgi:hypothetical protein